MMSYPLSAIVLAVVDLTLSCSGGVSEREALRV
jgi:hypothetical protein